jgi:hypothetical protein
MDRITSCHTLAMVYHKLTHKKVVSIEWIGSHHCIRDILSQNDTWIALHCILLMVYHKLSTTHRHGKYSLPRKVKPISIEWIRSRITYQLGLVTKYRYINE